MVLLVSVHIVALNSNPGVDSFNCRTIWEGLLASSWVSDESSEPVDFTLMFSMFSISLLLMKILVEPCHFSLVVFLLVLSILDFSIVLLLFSHGLFFSEFISSDANIVIGHHPGVWGINHGTIWERLGAICVLEETSEWVHWA